VKQAGGRSGDLFDIFKQKNEESGTKKSPAIKRVLEVTLEDLYKGATKELEIQRQTADSKSKKCDRCDGDGVITTIQRMGPMMFQQRAECPTCEGQGYLLESNMATIQVHIPLGGKTGELVTVHGEGHRYPEHAPGDVVLQLKTLKHEVFTRQGADLGMTTTLSLREALCGYELKIRHVNGHVLVVTPPKDKHEIVQPGSLKCVYTYGMPQRYTPHVKGHLYIVMDVKLPLSHSLSNKNIQQLKNTLPKQIIEQVDESKEGAEGAEDDEEKKSNNNASTSKQSKTSDGKKTNKKKNGKKSSNSKKKRQIKKMKREKRTQ